MDQTTGSIKELAAALQTPIINQEGDLDQLTPDAKHVALKDIQIEKLTQENTLLKS